MATAESSPTAPIVGRSLPIWGFLVIVVGYLAIIQGVGLAVDGVEPLTDGKFLEIDQILVQLWIPLGLAVLFFFLITATQISADPWPTAAIAVLAYVIAGILVLVRRHRIELPAATAAG